MKIFDYSDVILIPQKGIVNSRNECDTSVKLGNFTFKIPVIPANMESVIDEDLCIKLAENGYFYIMHRFGIDNKAFIKKMKSLGLFTSISIGVNEDSYDLIADLVHGDLMPDFITIDIAHGHSIKMENMIKFIKTFGSNSFIICGNICTKEAVIDLTEWGADCLKVGIAPGEVCTTYQNTSFGSRGHQASTILELSSISELPIIADGGIRKNGDINVALSMGASMIMVGGMLSGFEDSPGNVIVVNGIHHKEFWGSASQYQSNKKNRIEGTKVLKVLKNRSIIDELISIEESIQSGISYAGGVDISSLKKVKYKIKFQS